MRGQAVSGLGGYTGKSSGGPPGATAIELEASLGPITRGAAAS